MTKGELIDVVAGNAKISKASASKAIDSLFDGITKALKKGDRVTIVGFGAFSVSRRKARRGRNPQTGAEIRIPSAKVPKFSAGTALKAAIR